MRDRLTACAIVAGLLLGGVGAVFYSYYRVHANEREVTCTVTGKSLGSGKHRHRKRRVHTTQCGTLANETSLWFWKSSRDVRDVDEQLRPGITIAVRIAGQRLDTVGRYPNIIRVLGPAG